MKLSLAHEGSFPKDSLQEFLQVALPPTAREFKDAVEVELGAARATPAHLSGCERVEGNHASRFKPEVMKATIEETLHSARIVESLDLDVIVDVAVHKDGRLPAIDEQAGGDKGLVDAIGLSAPIEAGQVRE